MLFINCINYEILTQKIIRNMKTKVIGLICSILCFVQINIKANPQPGHSDLLLVFRNTGEITLMHVSKMDSIVTSCIDTEGKINDKPTSQVFYAKDTTIVVPIAEIDSVSFGAHNEIIFNARVRKLSTDNDLPWIIRYEGSCIYYRSNTPQNILPSVGQYLFYNQFDETFPIGLTALVTGVANKGSEIEVCTKNVGYTEIFDKFFYAGPISDLNVTVNKAKGTVWVSKTTENISGNAEIKGTLAMDGIGETSLKGFVSVSGDVVLHPFSNYYHADLTFDFGLNYNLQLQAKENTSVNLQENLGTIPLLPVAAIFRPSVSFGAFMDAKAEMNFNYDMERHSLYRILWERKGDKQTFERKQPEESKPGNLAKAEVVLDGSVYLGVLTQVDFNLIGNSLGARAKVKYGPEVSGKISMGLLNNLEKEYKPEVYGSAELAYRTKLQFQGFTVTRSMFIWGEEQEHKFLELESSCHERKLDAFPHFFSQRAVEVKKNGNPQISVAAKSKNEIVSKVETGFQVVDKEEKVLAETIVEEIKADTTAVQTVKTELPVPTGVKDVDDVKVRPVFKYTGRTIPFANVGISQNPNIQPVIAFGSNGTASFVSGVPVVGTASSDKTTFHVGPYISVAVYDKDFHKTSPYAGHGGQYIESNKENEFVGKWKANIEGKNVVMTFEKEGKGKVDIGTEQTYDATYYVNCPQSGYMTINYEKSPIVMKLISIDATTMRILFRTTFDTTKEYIFTKQ